MARIEPSAIVVPRERCLVGQVTGCARRHGPGWRLTAATLGDVSAVGHRSVEDSLLMVYSGMIHGFFPRHPHPNSETFASKPSAITQENVLASDSFAFVGYDLPLWNVYPAAPR